MDYVSSSWVGTNIGLLEVAASRLRYDIPASSVVSASTWPDLFTLAVRYTVCFDPGITDSSVTSTVHYGSSNQSTWRTDIATAFQQALQSLAEAFEVVPGLGKCPLQSTAIINGSLCDLHEIYSLAKAQSYASHCTKVVANFHKVNLYVMHWDDIIVRHLEELFSEFDSVIILLLLQQNAAQFFDLALNVDVPEFSLHAIKFSTDASIKLPLKSDSEFRRWAPVLPYNLLNWKQSVRFVLCFDPGSCSHLFGYVLAFLAFTVRYLYVRALKVSVAILAAFFLSVLAVIRPFGSFQMSGTAHVLAASSALNGSIANSVSHLHALADVMFIFAQVKFLTDQLHMLVSAYKHHVAHLQASAWCATFCPGVEVATAIPGMASLGTGCLVSTTLIALVLRILCFDPGIGCYNCYGCHKYKMLAFSPLKDTGVLSSSPTLILVFSRVLHWYATGLLAILLQYSSIHIESPMFVLSVTPFVNATSVGVENRVSSVVLVHNSVCNFSHAVHARKWIANSSILSSVTNANVHHEGPSSRPNKFRRRVRDSTFHVFDVWSCIPGQSYHMFSMLAA